MEIGDKIKVNFRDVFILLKKWFDFPTPHYDDFDAWRHKTYEQQRTKQLKNIPLKTWWPKYRYCQFNCVKLL